AGGTLRPGSRAAGRGGGGLRASARPRRIRRGPGWMTSGSWRSGVGARGDIGTRRAGIGPGVGWVATPGGGGSGGGGGGQLSLLQQAIDHIAVPGDEIHSVEDDDLIDLRRVVAGGEGARGADVDLRIATRHREVQVVGQVAVVRRDGDGAGGTGSGVGRRR